MKKITTSIFALAFAALATQSGAQQLYDQVESSALQSCNDQKGNIIPDFSRVGYHFGDKDLPEAEVVMRLQAPEDGADATKLIQSAINKVGRQSKSKRGAILLEKGTYNISKTILIESSGIVLRGEKNDEDPSMGTVLVASDTTKQYDLIEIGRRSDIVGDVPTQMNIKDDYVPAGQFWVRLTNARAFDVKDRVILYTNHNQQWIEDIKMNQIVSSGIPGRRVVQWTPDKYKLKARRIITKVSGDTVWFENPVPEALNMKHGGGAVYKYGYSNGIVSEVGVEHLFIKSDYNHDTHENHGWIAVKFTTSEHCWVRDVDSKHFGFALVHIESGKNITVIDCKNSDSKSIINGGRRYSFSTSSELALFKNCIDEDGRHSFVCSPFNCGPNVFVNCSATQTHSDIGPHHRWNVATLYDNVVTDGIMNIADRGYMGTGHGWAGVNNVFWNCESQEARVESVYEVGHNYSVGQVGGRSYRSALPNTERPQGVWVSQGQHVSPLSLYEAQLALRKSIQKDVFDVK